jgi:UDP-N-acetylglucosamine acyltransferase
MIQTLAYIDPQAKIAANVVVEPFTVIHKNVTIGEGSWIGPNVTIFPNTKIGKCFQAQYWVQYLKI